jgi:hypothetical protein
VSTFPVTFDGSAQAAMSTVVPGEGRRETIDPDDFASGFGVWSGTSFAAPVLAAQIAQRLFAGTGGSLDPADRGATIDRCWNAITAEIGLARP